MIDILSVAQALLRESGYGTRLLPFGEGSLLSFEDESILGFCCVFPDAELILGEWQRTETALLHQYGGRFRVAREKAWNIYCVFLSDAAADSVLTREVAWVEENQERTRKIAACSVSTREAVQRALLPLLRLQYSPALQVEGITERLLQRIEAIAPNAAKVALKEDVAPIEVVRLLGDIQ